MESLFVKITEILTQPPGSLTYHLTLAISILAAWQAAFSKLSPTTVSQRRRFMIALSMILIGQLALFTLSGLGWQKIYDSRPILPLLDRGLTVFYLAWIIWLWGFNQPSRTSDMISEIFNLGVIAVLGFTFFVSNREAPLPFNGTWMDTAWQLAAIFVCLGGMLLLVINHPRGWVFGMVFLSINLLGSFVHWLIPPTSGDFSPYTRLAQICSFPLLSGWVIHFLSETVEPVVRPAPLLLESRQMQAAAPPDLAQAWLQAAVQNDPSKQAAALARAVARSFSADICLITALSNHPDQLHFRGGFDLARNQELKAAMLPLERIPSIAASILQGQSLIQNDSSAADHAVLANAIGIERTGSLIYAPLHEAAMKPSQGLLLLSPYSGRQWSERDLAFLLNSSDSIAELISRQEQVAALDKGEPDAFRDLAAEKERLKAHNQDLRAELISLRETMNSQVPNEAASEKTAGDPIDLAAAMDRAAAAARERLAGRKINIQRSLAEGLPTPQIEMETLERILAWLMDSASALTPEDGTATLTADKETDAGGAEFVVIQAAGSGVVQAEEMQHTDDTQPFIPNDGQQASVDAIKSLIESFGGQLRVEPAAFSVRIPASSKERLA